MFTDVFGQTKLKDNLVDDSTILKLKIKRVTENWYTDIQNANPSQTTIEVFDTTGNITQRTHINYTYHKFVSDFIYNEKKGKIKVVEKYYDWNPYREKNKNDTILKTTIEKYNLSTKENVDFKRNTLNQFHTKVLSDSLGRIIQSTDTIKCGYQISYYQYDDKSNLVKMKSYIIHHSERPELSVAISFYYDTKGRKIKEVKHFDFKKIDVEEKNGGEEITEYQYNEFGLIKEKVILKSDKTIYKYDYLFY